MKLTFKYIAIVFLASLSMFSSCKNDNEQVTQKAKKVPLVKVQTAQKSKMVSYIDITGTLQANIFTDIESPADGIIESLMARENQNVVKDKIIAVINPNERVTLISNNQLEIEKLERKINSLDKNSDEYQDVVQKLEKAKDNLAYAQKMYQTIPVICPMSGLVTERWLDIGSQVGAKEKILTISDMNSLVIKAEVNEKYFETVKQGKKIPVILNAYPNDTITGTISLVYPQVDAVTRSVKFDIKLSGFNKSLIQGMMASIKIPVSVKENAVSVPEQSLLVAPDNKNFIFIVDKDSISHRRVVETGIVSGNKVEIVQGLKEKENVVVMGQEMLKDSVKVKIMKK